VPRRGQRRVRKASTLLGLGAVLASATLLAGCGVPSSGPSEPVPSGQVPYGLLDPHHAVPRTGPTGAASPSATRAPGRPSVFFVKHDRLVPAPLTAPGAAASGAAAPGTASGDTRTVLSQLVLALSTGPSADQRAQGLDTALPSALHLAVRSVRADGLATIDLQGGDSGTVGDQGPLAVGQVVLTATSVPGVDRVLLTRQGAPVAAQLAGGELTDTPLVPAEYASLLAPE